MQIGLSTRALNALERAHVLTAGDLVALASRRLYAMSGVRAKTRAEILAAKDALATKWAAEGPTPVAPASTTSADSAAEVISIDLLTTRLLPRRTRSVDVGDPEATLSVHRRIAGGFQVDKASEQVGMLGGPTRLHPAAARVRNQNRLVVKASNTP